MIIATAKIGEPDSIRIIKRIGSYKPKDISHITAIEKRITEQVLKEKSQDTKETVPQELIDTFTVGQPFHMEAHRRGSEPPGFQEVPLFMPPVAGAGLVLKKSIVRYGGIGIGALAGFLGGLLFGGGGQTQSQEQEAETTQETEQTQETDTTQETSQDTEQATDIITDIFAQHGSTVHYENIVNEISHSISESVSQVYNIQKSVSVSTTTQGQEASQEQSGLLQMLIIAGTIIGGVILFKK